MNYTDVFLNKKYKWPITLDKCLTPLFIRETEIKTTLRFHLIPVRMAYYQENKK
jgi:hypothetical protein